MSLRIPDRMVFMVSHLERQSWAISGSSDDNGSVPT
jgi:hypothetical protein